jgi:hypothetical protein
MKKKKKKKEKNMNGRNIFPQNINRIEIRAA